MKTVSKLSIEYSILEERFFEKVGFNFFVKYRKSPIVLKFCSMENETVCKFELSIENQVLVYI